MNTYTERDEIFPPQFFQPDQGNITKRLLWMPPEEVIQYVRDTIYQSKGLEELKAIEAVSMMTIPIIIKTTMDWVTLSGWWPFTYSSTYMSGEEYKSAFRHIDEKIHADRMTTSVMELDPESFVTFRYSRDRNALAERLENPSLTSEESSEIVSLVRDYYCPAYNIKAPSIEDCHTCIWATLMWLIDFDCGEEWLADYGGPIFSNSICRETPDIVYFTKIYSRRLEEVDWKKLIDLVKIYTGEFYFGGGASNAEENEVLGHVFGVLLQLYRIPEEEVSGALSELHQYFELFCADYLEGGFIDYCINEEIINDLKFALEERLCILDPMKIEKMGSNISECADCGESLWCANKFFSAIELDTGDTQNEYTTLCHHCFEAREEDDNIAIQNTESHNEMRKCTTCRNTECPWIPSVEDQWGRRTPKFLVEAGSKRVNHYKKQISKTGQTYAQLMDNTDEGWEYDQSYGKYE